MEGKSYAELQYKISETCQKYGYKQCNICPLVHACLIERNIEDGESEKEFTERWENGMAEEFAKLFPELV